MPLHSISRASVFPNFFWGVCHRSRSPIIISMLCMVIILPTIGTDCVSMDGPFPHVQICSVQNLPDQSKIASSAPAQWCKVK